MFKLTIIVLVSMVMLTHSLPLAKLVNDAKVEAPKQEDQPQEQDKATGKYLVFNVSYNCFIMYSSFNNINRCSFLEQESEQADPKEEEEQGRLKYIENF